MFEAPKSIPDPLPTQTEFIRELLDSTFRINREEILTALIESGLSKSETPIQSYNRAIISVLRKRDIPVSRKNPIKPETVIETKNGISKIVQIIGDAFNIWYKKLLKTGKTTNPIRKTSLKIEIYTFEKNDECRFDSLLEAVQKEVPELEYIDGAGYESTRDNSGEYSPYQFESAYLIVQSGQGTKYFDGTVTLKDTNEPPC